MREDEKKDSKHMFTPLFAVECGSSSPLKPARPVRRHKTPVYAAGQRRLWIVALTWKECNAGWISRLQGQSCTFAVESEGKPNAPARTSWETGTRTTVQGSHFTVESEGKPNALARTSWEAGTRTVVYSPLCGRE